jgi:hypothetical protein
MSFLPAPLELLKLTVCPLQQHTSHPTYKYTCKYLYTPIYIQTYKYIFIYVYVYIYIYTYMHMSIYVYIPSQFDSFSFSRIYRAEHRWAAPPLVLRQHHLLTQTEKLKYKYINIHVCIYIDIYACTVLHI